MARRFLLFILLNFCFANFLFATENKTDSLEIKDYFDEYSKLKESNLDSAFIILKKADSVIYETKKKEILYRLYLKYGDYYSLKKDLVAMQEAFVKAEEYTKKYTPDSLAFTYFELAIKFRYVHQFDLVHKYYSKIIDELNLDKNSPYFLKAALNKLGLYVYSKMQHEADSMIERYSPLLRQAMNPYIKAMYHSISSVHYSNLGQYNKALEIQRNALCYHISQGDTVNIISLYMQMGGSHFYLNQLDSAAHFWLTTIEVAEKANDIASKAKCLNNLAMVSKYQYRYKKAIEYMKKSAEIKHHRNDTLGLASTYINIGLIYGDLNDIVKAKEYYRKCIAFCKGDKSLTTRSMALSNMSNLYKREDSLTMAKSYLERSLEIRRKLGNPLGYSVGLRNLAELYLAIGGKEDIAYDLSVEALEIALQTENEEVVASSYLFLGATLLRLDSLTQAGHYLKKAEAFENTASDLSSKLNFYETLYQYYQELGEYEKAMGYTIKLMGVKDSIYKEENSEAMAIKSAEFELNQKEWENKILTEKASLVKENNQLLAKQQRATLVILILVVFFGAALLLYLRNRKRSAEKETELKQLKLDNAEKEKTILDQKMQVQKKTINHHELQLDALKREMNSYFKQVNSFHDFFDEALENLHTLKANGQMNGELDALIEKMSRRAETENNWAALKLQVEHSMPGFFEKLLEKHPDLTEYELKLITFLFMRLSTKDIAKQFSVSEAAISKSRGRLRKKLNLEQRQDFLAYIERIMLVENKKIVRK